MISTYNPRNNVLLILALLVISLLLASAIVYQSIIFILAAAVLILIYLVLRSDLFSFGILLFLAFFGFSLEEMHVLPAQINWLSEFIIFLLLAKAVIQKVLRKEKFHMKFMGVFLFFILFVWISYQVHATSLAISLLFLRLLIRFYLLFLAIINLDLDEKFIKTTNKILIFLFIIQIPTAVIKLFFYGIGEEAIGTYSTHGGGPSTVIPLMTLSFLLAFYFYYKPSKWYILLALGFIAFGLIGGKRALFLYLPVVVLFIGFYMRERFKRAFVYLILVSVLILLTGYLSIRLMPTLNPQQRVGGEVDLDYVLNYLTHYTMARFEGSSGGRVITTIQVFEILRNEGFPSVMFGLGPGTYMETRFEALQTTLVETDSLPIKYGVPGSSWLAIQVGYVGALIYHLLFIVILAYAVRFFKTETDPYWKAYGLGMVGFSFVMFLISLTYWPVFIDDLLPLIYFMLTGFLVLKKMKSSSIEQSA